MDAFHHMIYEIDRGVRALAIYTTSFERQTEVEARIQRAGLRYLVDDSGRTNLNVFFGRAECIETLERFSTLRLDKITHEEDFILGSMLGYDLCKQCRRYNERRPTAVEAAEAKQRPSTTFFNSCATAGICGMTCSLKAMTPIKDSYAEKQSAEAPSQVGGPGRQGQPR